ncbi:MAG: lytic transglycosylase domain-containing protein [Gammaproteobacteria bacterium]|nr:MAG: lytic transglycosylase domain-containing protein [Gammaproteobacteria bacterium]
MRLTRKWTVLACLLLYSVAAEAGMLLYVYQLPDGSRMVTNYQLNNGYYKLIRVGENFNGMGLISAGSNPQFFRPSTTAYDDLIRRAVLEHGLDFALVKAIMHVESAFNPYARSHKGAYGLMQLLPETAQRYGVERSELYDPHRNIEAGVRYLKFLTGQFRDIHHVIAAYNAGENAVSAYGGIPPYAETKSYVTKVLKQQRRYAARS